MSSSDPILTTLCSICHIQPPKYRCPRCAVRTCSLSCTRRHKAWSSCSGIRDATAYVPPSKLKTPAGVDHDFNFLSGIERAVQRSEKEIVEERGLLAPEELRPVEVRSVQWRRRKDGSQRRVLVTEVLRNQGASAGGSASSRPELSKQMRKRLSTFGTYIRRVPTGMARQKQNGTNVAKSSGRMNWQVEWLLLDKNQKANQSSTDEAPGAPLQTKILGKALDHLPLYTAFSNNHAAYLEFLAPKDDSREEMEPQHDTAIAATVGIKSKKRKQPPPVPDVQNQTNTTWPLSDYSLQPFPTACWKRYSGTALFTGLTEAERAQQAKFDFYLSPNPLSKTADGKILVYPADPLESLAEALRDTTVLEFPTFYVVPASVKLPAHLFTSTSKQPNFRAPDTLKRKYQDNAPHGRGGKAPAPGKLGKKPRRDLEDGEIQSYGEGYDDTQAGRANKLSAHRSRAESDGEDAAGGYEVVAEESLGEDDEDDTTSSSGSEPDSGDEECGGLIQTSLDKKLTLLGRKHRVV